MWWRFRSLWRNWWFVTLFVTFVLMALVAFALPIVWATMRPTGMRIAGAGFVFGLWLLLVFFRWWRARRAAKAIADALLTPDPGDVEGALLATRLGDALKSLRTISGARRDYLYSRPWYVIIGPPGAGKTTALLNSGLRFPLAEQSLKGVGGTRNLDFWFADEAVLIDTAGRYTTQDSDRAVDARGWGDFLKLLKKHRPLQPVNGVIVAIGVDELIRADCGQIDAHAAAVRRRLVEVRSTLEVAAPVYVLLTKADLLAGFSEYQDDLDVEGRRAVLGVTLPFATGKPVAAQLATAFDEVAQAVADRQAKRLFEEVDQSRRSLLLGFPSQLGSLRSRLMRFLEGAFVSGEEGVGSLRGFYLTSGVQEGAPLDRILSGMAQVYDRPPERAAASGGRAYFLNRLLGEVMFGEAGLVSLSPAARARQKARLIGACVGIGAVTALVLAVWTVSFTRNRAFQNDLLAQSNAAQALAKEAGIDLVEVGADDADLRAALPYLDAMRTLPRGYADRQAGGAPFSMRAGLFQTGASQQAEEAYREALKRVMLPRLLLRTEAVMRENAQEPLALYEPLKVYLMLGGQGPLSPGSVRAWVKSDWANELYPGADSAAERGRLAKHLDALLTDDDLASVWPRRRAAIDGRLVASARAAVGTLSLADRAYAVMRQKAATAGAPWQMAGVLSAGDALAFADPDAIMTVEVPYFFTRPGFEKNYQLGLASVQKDLSNDLWVLGGDAQNSGVQAEMSSLRPGVAGLYARDYIAHWERVIASLKPSAFFANPAAFGAFTKSPSPVKRVLLELRKNTSFGGGVDGAVGELARQRFRQSRLSRYTSGSGQIRETGVDAGEEITDYFSAVHQYVGNGKSPGPIDEFVAAVKAAGQAVIAARSVGGGGGAEATQAGMATALASVQAAAAGAPPQLQGFVTEAARGGSTARVGAAQGAVTDAYAQAVLPQCRSAATDRYPFYGAATQDVAIVDALRVFGMGGVIPAFIEQRLTPLMDTAGPVWRWKEDPIAATLDPATPAEFARAAGLRDLLAGGLPIKVALAALGSEIVAAEFASGGTSYRFDRETNQPRPLLWAAQGQVPEASVALFGEPVPIPPTLPTAKAAPAPAPAAPVPPPELRRIQTQGSWALFRLLDRAQRENAGERAIKATFGEGARSATFLISLPGDRDPFARGGLWAFRCPNTL